MRPDSKMVLTRTADPTNTSDAEVYFSIPICNSIRYGFTLEIEKMAEASVTVVVFGDVMHEWGYEVVGICQCIRIAQGCRFCAKMSFNEVSCLCLHCTTPSVTFM